LCIPGYWEGDLIKSKRNQSQVGTVVESTTLYVALVKLDNDRAETAAEGFSEILNRFDAAMRLSMTYDQEREMAGHEELRRRPQRLLVAATRLIAASLNARPRKSLGRKAPFVTCC